MTRTVATLHIVSGKARRSLTRHAQPWHWKSEPTVYGSCRYHLAFVARPRCCLNPKFAAREIAELLAWTTWATALGHRQARRSLCAAFRSTRTKWTGFLWRSAIWMIDTAFSKVGDTALVIGRQPLPAPKIAWHRCPEQDLSRICRRIVVALSPARGSCRRRAKSARDTSRLLRVSDSYEAFIQSNVLSSRSCHEQPQFHPNCQHAGFVACALQGPFGRGFAWSRSASPTTRVFSWVKRDPAGQGSGQKTQG